MQSSLPIKFDRKKVNECTSLIGEKRFSREGGKRGIEKEGEKMIIKVKFEIYKNNKNVQKSRTY